MSAVLQLNYNKKKMKKNTIIDIVVIRIGRDKKMKCSKPCHHCLKFLVNLPYYTIRNIYYSDGEGDIIKKRLVDLWREDKHHISKNFKK